MFVNLVDMDRGETRRTFLVGGALGVARHRARRPRARACSPHRGREVGRALTVGAPPLRNSDYWDFADWLQPAMDRLWSDSQHVYTNDTRINSSALMTHAIAAFEGHEGAARNDERARMLAARLCEEPPLRLPRNGRPTRHSDPRSETQLHAPGWVSSMARRDSSMHLSIDPKVARALYYAWRAREQLGLSAGAGRADGAVRALGRASRRSSCTRTCGSTRSTSPPSCTPARSA